MYSTHDVVVTGSVLPPPGSQVNYIPFSAYLNLKAGWNLIILDVTATNAQGQVTAYSMTSGIPDSSIVWGVPTVTGNTSTPAVRIDNLPPGQSTVLVVPHTLSEANVIDYDFTEIAGGDYPYLVWEPFVSLNGRYGVVVITDQGGIRYLNNVQFTNGLATEPVNWNNMNVVTP